MDKIAPYKIGQEIKFSHIVHNKTTVIKAEIVDLYYNDGKKSYKTEGWVYLVRFVRGRNQFGTHLSYLEIYEEKIIS